MKRARSSNSCWRNAIADNQQCDNNICRFKPIVTHERSAGSAPLTIFSSHTLSDRTHSENTKQNDKHKKTKIPVEPSFWSQSPLSQSHFNILIYEHYYFMIIAGKTLGANYEIYIIIIKMLFMAADGKSAGDMWWDWALHISVMRPSNVAPKRLGENTCKVCMWPAELLCWLATSSQSHKGCATFWETASHLQMQNIIIWVIRIEDILSSSMTNQLAHRICGNRSRPFFKQ